jgi:predicted alpha-1,2-mannosidase
MRSINFFLASTAFVLSNFSGNCQSSQSIKDINPLIGVLGSGNTHPAATSPYSVVSLSPDAIYPQSTSGYSLVVGNKFIGFSHTRTSGTGGGGRYGNFLVTPQCGKTDLMNKEIALKNEFASPGFYSCDVEKGNIHAALTLTENVGFHQYSFRENDTAIILIDVSSNRLTKDKSKCTEADVEIISDKNLQGYAKFEGGWGGLNPYIVYFYAEFDKPCLQKGTWNQNIIRENISSSSKASKDLYLGAFFKFKLSPNDQTVKLKLAISYTGINQAKKYFNKSQGWDFNTFKKDAEAKWENFLSRIKVSGGTVDQRKLFYTSFYRTAMMPRDLSGDNPLWKSTEPHFWDFYTFWDTYRTLNPLLTLVDPNKECQIIRCLLDIYQHKGWLPDAFTAGNYGTIQGGTNADVVIAEAIVKGLKGFDYELAYQAMINDVEKQSPNPGGANSKFD